MVSLAIILRVEHQTGSYARAGAVSACYVLGTAVGMPLLGRAADRLGRRPVLVGAAAVNAAGLCALATVPVAMQVVTYLVAVVAGASLPPVAPVVRSLWREIAPPEERSSLYAIDATLQEVTFMTGPALVALISAVASPAVALASSGLIGLGGTLALVIHPALGSRPPDGSPAEPRGQAKRARSSSLALLAGTMLLLLAAISVVEVATVAFAGRHGAPRQAGLLLTVWSTGSLAGGLLFGSAAARRAGRVLARLLLAAAFGFAVLAAAPTVAVLYVLLFLAGTSISPGFSCIYDIVGRTSPPQASVESFSWVSSGIQIGASMGTALGGVVVDGAGTRLAFVIAGGIGLLTAMVPLLGRQVISRAEQRSEAAAVPTTNESLAGTL
jgi:MFS family permease